MICDQPIAPNATGALESIELDIGLRLDRGNLVFYDRLTRQVLYSEAEAAEAARAAEKTAREAAEQRAAELETELQRLRDELKKQARDS